MRAPQLTVRPMQTSSSTQATATNRRKSTPGTLLTHQLQPPLQRLLHIRPPYARSDSLRAPTTATRLALLPRADTRQLAIDSHLAPSRRLTGGIGVATLVCGRVGMRARCIRA